MAGQSEQPQSKSTQPQRYLLHAVVKPGKLSQYLQMHDNIYPEVVAGLRGAGATQITIFMKDKESNAENQQVELFMYVTMKPGIDLGKATGKGSDYRNGHPRIREWEELMESEFHSGWTELKEVFDLADH